MWVILLISVLSGGPGEFFFPDLWSDLLPTAPLAHKNMPLKRFVFVCLDTLSACLSLCLLPASLVAAETGGRFQMFWNWSPGGSCHLGSGN